MTGTHEINCCADLAIIPCFSAAAVGALATGTAPDFYQSLSRPGWAPPASVFGPVWTVLYFLMAVSIALTIVAFWRIRPLAGRC